MKIAVTADLHWGHGERGNHSTLALVEYLRQNPPDVLLLGGDLGTADYFNQCLELFVDLPCQKALVPGNHDVWISDNDLRGDSLDVYEKHLSSLALLHGYHYLDHGPMMLAEGLAVVGNMNWYDYSWSLEKLKTVTDDWEVRLKYMQFTRGRHNDRRFVRWELDDVRFTKLIVERFEDHLEQALNEAEKVLVLTHHPAIYGLNFPRDTDGPLSMDALLWDAFSGNRTIEALLERHADRIAIVFSCHTHRARENKVGNTPAYNIGGDYHFKRLLYYHWPSGEVEAHSFEHSKTT